MTTVWPWLALILLGAYHGINPAMGWLFAVALGLQRKSRRAVLEALAPIAFGHEASVTLVVALVSGAQLVISPDVIRAVGAVALIGFGVFKLLRPRSHPRWVGMQVTILDLVVWSFLMSTAHGAGLMLFPILLGLSPPIALDGNDAAAAGFTTTSVVQDLAAVMLHTASMLVVMAIVALLVYEKLGVAVLRKAWLNLDRLWAIVVVGAGVVTFLT